MIQWFVVISLYRKSELLSIENSERRYKMYERYVELRDKKGVTDYRVALETNIPKSTFSEWKSGQSRPGVEKLYRIAKYFGVNMEYFLE